MATAKKKPAPKKKAPAKKAAPAKAKVHKPAKAVAGLTELERRFVEEYFKDPNGSQAYKLAKPGAKDTTARTEASKLLAKPNVAAFLADLRAKQSQRTEISADLVVREAWAIAMADPRELAEHLIGCCRHCWGKGHRWQRTAYEFEQDEAANAAANEALVQAGKPGVKEFDPKGGIGYDKRRAPHPDCPECFGEGVGRTLFKDTRHLSPAAASLFAGIKETKEGFEIKLHDKGAAMDKVFRHLGLYNDKIQLTMPTAVIKDMTGRKPE